MSNERSEFTTADALSRYAGELKEGGFSQPVIDQLVVHASEHLVLGRARRDECGQESGALRVKVIVNA
ncbi:MULTISPECIES: hypothetical protein [unclassified Rhodococcus (in: high G+C Gram-positive bacteria)]|uniref:hypothetical protein n=1 Tax=unclassified Rhodococcus (in: high G+C Gram-positive bacteria) TaxID=192944 RepID=UPI001AE5ED7B|nr:MULTISPECIES: hypothetical protein [unclassified Rhodococcus (in: high G+C Gram-positive bacteria)]MBP2524257.1 hypothetical protein [Rhodococcus sp. PvP104]MDA3637460.1 hypothetical protein [Rhodococcus sp. C-2]